MYYVQILVAAAAVMVATITLPCWLKPPRWKAAAFGANMAANAGGEPDAAAGGPGETTAAKRNALEPNPNFRVATGVGSSKVWEEILVTLPPSLNLPSKFHGRPTAAGSSSSIASLSLIATAVQTTAAATAAESEQTTADAGGKTTAAATPAAAGGTTAAANSSSKGIRNMKLDKPTRPSDETTSAASSQGAALDDAKPWWEGLEW